MARHHNIAVFALAAAMAAFAAPTSAPAQSFEANLEAIGPALAARAGARAEALRECNARSERMTNYTWGMQQSDVYRACMTQRGQVE